MCFPYLYSPFRTFISPWPFLARGFFLPRIAFSAIARHFCVIHKSTSRFRAGPHVIFFPFLCTCTVCANILCRNIYVMRRIMLPVHFHGEAFFCSLFASFALAVYFLWLLLHSEIPAAPTTYFVAYRDKAHVTSSRSSRRSKSSTSTSSHQVSTRGYSSPQDLTPSLEVSDIDTFVSVVDPSFLEELVPDSPPPDYEDLFPGDPPSYESLFPQARFSPVLKLPPVKFVPLPPNLPVKKRSRRSRSKKSGHFGRHSRADWHDGDFASTSCSGPFYTSFE